MSGGRSGHRRLNFAVFETGGFDGLADLGLGVSVAFIVGVRNFGNDQKFGFFEHRLLAKRQFLFVAQKSKFFEDIGGVKDTAGVELVGKLA